MARADAGYAGEQLGRYDTPRMRKWTKRIAVRKDRQAARRLGEDAPKKRRYAGWSD